MKTAEEETNREAPLEVVDTKFTACAAEMDPIPLCQLQIATMCALEQPAPIRSPLHGPTDLVELKCSDGPIAISGLDLLQLCDAGNVLGKLIYGEATMRTEVNLGVFAEYGVSKVALNAIKGCIRLGGKFPDDEMTNTLLRTGELRNCADNLGGFAIVDKALSELNLATHRQRKRRIDAPEDDVEHKYEWRSIPRHAPEQVVAYQEFHNHLKELQSKGFEMSYSRPWLCHLRRRMSPATPPVEEDPR